MECQEIRRLAAAFNPIKCMTVWSGMHRSRTAVKRNALRPHLAEFRRPTDCRLNGRDHRPAKAGEALCSGSGASTGWASTARLYSARFRAVHRDCLSTGIHPFRFYDRGGGGTPQVGNECPSCFGFLGIHGDGCRENDATYSQSSRPLVAGSKGVVRKNWRPSSVRPTCSAW